VNCFQDVKHESWFALRQLYMCCCYYRWVKQTS